MNKKTGNNINIGITEPVIPAELIGGFKACAALKSDSHWAVYVALMEHDATSVDGLSRIFDGTYHEIVLILDDLEDAQLVEKFTIWDDEGSDYSRLFYRVTMAGLRFFARIMESLLPSKHMLERIETMKRRKNHERNISGTTVKETI